MSYTPTTAQTLLDELAQELGLDPDYLTTVPASERTTEVVAIAWDAARCDEEACRWLHEKAPKLASALFDFDPATHSCLAGDR